ncbi:MAG: type II secretion system protein [Candidatus Omnitrophota bacterium]
MQKNSGFSLIELLMVIALLGIIGGALFGTLSSSRIGLDAANEQINRQQEARRAVDRIVNELRTSNPSWGVDSTSYPITISSLGKRIDFYIPTFVDGELTKLSAVRYEASQSTGQLLRKQGSVTSVLANDLDTDYLYVQSGGNPIFDFANVENSIINIVVPIARDDASFILSSQLNFRNREEELTGVQIEEITDGGKLLNDFSDP